MFAVKLRDSALRWVLKNCFIVPPLSLLWSQYNWKVKQGRRGPDSISGRWMEVKRLSGWGIEAERKVHYWIWLRGR